jgi:GT2 family glycosyltransferase
LSIKPEIEIETIVSVIILNYNGKEYIEECIDSILRQTCKDRKIIVVDNGSTDGSLEIIKEKFADRIRLIENKDNLGFAEGNNIGISSSTGSYIALLNNDAVADDNWLSELVDAARKSDSNFGMWASKILFYDDHKIIDTAGHLIYPDGLNRGRGKGEVDKGQYDKVEEVFFPSGCAALYSKSMLDQIGLFDPDFFAYGDDTDIGLRARIAAWNCLYVPTAIVYHRSSATTGRYSPLKAYLVERNRLWILIKYFPLRYILLSPLYTLMRLILQAYGALTGKGAAGRFTEQYSLWKLISVLLKACFDAIRGSLKMIRKRLALNKIKKTSTRDFFLWIKRYRISAKEIALRD